MPPVCAGQLHGDREPLQRQGMTTFTQLAPASSDRPEPFTDRLRLAVAAYLARFKGSSRELMQPASPRLKPGRRPALRNE
jgi:hypothetical protein